MEGEPRYRLEILDRVLRDNGCVSETSQANRMTRGWMRTDTTDSGGVPTLARYTPDGGTLSVPCGVVVTLALDLQLDPDKIMRLLERAGGLLSDPYRPAAPRLSSAPGINSG